MKVLFTAHLSRPFLVISNELFNERRNLWRERERENENGSIHLHDFFHLLSEQGGTRISVIHAIGLRILSFSLRISFEDFSSLLEIFNHGSLDSYSGRFFLLSQFRSRNNRLFIGLLSQRRNLRPFVNKILDCLSIHVSRE